jgi:hypothetical protein
VSDPSGKVPRVTDERESWLKMSGDALREIGLLYFVFGILDAQIESRRQPTEAADYWWFVRVIGISAIIWFAGAAAERLRRE